MSRILRRPLFRGGSVSSYGTGIASGLADGGRVGLRYSYPGTVGNAASGTNPGFTGAEIMEFIRNNPSKEGLNIFNSSMLKSKNPRLYYPMEASQMISSGRGSKSYTPFSTLASKAGEGQTDFEAVYRDMITSPMDYDFSEVKSQEEEKEKIENFGNKSIAEIIAENEESKEKAEEFGTADDRMTDDTMTIKQKEMTGEIDTRPSKEALKIAGIEETGNIEAVGEEANELGIQELADSYYKALKGDTEARDKARIKKARGQDIGDWLLKYSENVGKTGDWKDGFTETAGWIADRGPSRTEVIQEKITAKDDALREAGVKMAITETIGDKKLDKQFANQLKLMDKRVAGTIAAALAKSNDTDFDKIQKIITNPDSSAQEKSLAFKKLGLSGNFTSQVKSLMNKEQRNVGDTEALDLAETYFGALADGPIKATANINEVIDKDGIYVDTTSKTVVIIKDKDIEIIGNYSAG